MCLQVTYLTRPHMGEGGNYVIGIGYGPGWVKDVGKCHSTYFKDCQSILNYCKDLPMNVYNLEVTPVHS